MPIVRKPAQPDRRQLPPAESRAGSSAAGADASGASPAPSEGPSASQAPPRRRGHAQKSADGKWLPTGHKGFAAPPAEYQFKKGGRGGPGRPRGSVSTDTLWRKELEAKMTVRIDGKPVRLTSRELAIKAEIKDSHMGVRSARKAVLEAAHRLYQPAPESSDAQGVPHHELDQRILREFFGGLRLGEAAPAGGDFLSDALVAPFGTESEPDSEWEEGEWDTSGEGSPHDE